MQPLNSGIPVRRCLPLIFGLSFAGFIVSVLAGRVAAQTPAESLPGITRGVTEQGSPYMTGGVGSGEREKMQSLAGEYNLKLSFAETSGMYISDVWLSIAKDGRQILQTITNGPWFYIKLPPGVYTVEAAYENETKRIENLDIGKGDRVTRLIHWPAEKPS